MIDPLKILELSEDEDAVLVITQKRSYTRGELLRSGAAHKKQLEEVGVREGDLVIVSLDSGPAFIVALAGCWLLGATPVLLDPLVRKELNRAVDMTDARVVVRGGGSDDSSLSAIQVNPTEGQDVPEDPPNRDDNAPILYLFTSGSTGAPALISKTFGQLDVEVQFLKVLFSSPRKVATMAPWCHIFGLILSCLLPTRLRGVCELSGGISPKKVLELASTGSADLVVVVPAVIQVMVKYLEAGEIEPIPSSCQFVTSGAPLLSSLRSRMEELTGCRITDLYGSTEAGGVAYRHDDGAWQVQPHVRTRTTEDGFLEVSSPSVSISGDDGFYRIGDIVRWEGEGFHLMSRGDDVVKIGGRRTSLNEITSAMEECPDVVNAACIAAKISGANRLVAFVELKSDSSGPESVRSFLRTRLADHKVPRLIKQIVSLPRTPAGKVDRRRLKELAGDE